MAGIYIHIPFCKQACHYCNFHFSTGLSNKAAVLNAIVKEIDLTQAYNPVELIETIYFGGGTPSLLTKNELDIILSATSHKFSIAADAEITLEANPDDITGNVLNDWLAAGINRLSLGVQSFNEAELKWMNRAHNAAQSLLSIELIQAAGFNNFSVDLIYGSPLLTNQDFENNVRTIIDKRIPHISAYALTVEEKTALAQQIKKHQSLPVDEGQQLEQFELLLALTEAAGYEQYEISNFARPGFRSRHNSSYWQGKPYYGFGPSAHSYDGRNKRRWNIANNALYVQSINKDTIPFEEELLTATQQLNETIMIGLRTKEGIHLEALEEKFGKENKQAILDNAAAYINTGMLKTAEGHLRLTKKGKFLADGIAADLFF